VPAKNWSTCNLIDFLSVYENYQIEIFCSLLLIAAIGIASLIRYINSASSRLSRASGITRIVCEQALSGDTEACEVLGLALFKKASYEQASVFLETSAASDLVESITALIQIELLKKGVDINVILPQLRRLKTLDIIRYKTTAHLVYSKLQLGQVRSVRTSDPHDTICAYQLALKLEDEKHYSERMKLLHYAATDVSEADFVLARSYGVNVPGKRNISKAFQHYRSAIRSDIDGTGGAYREFLAGLSPVEVIDSALPEERVAIAKCLGEEEFTTSESSWESLSKAAGHSLANLWRDNTGVPYEEALEDVLKRMKIKVRKGVDILEIEGALVEFQFEAFLAALDVEERNGVLVKLKDRVAEEKLNYGSIGALGVGSLAVGAAGFTPYLMATTTLSALSGAVGVTLPFAAYTTLTSTVAVLTGPVGWALLIGATIFTLGKPNAEKTTNGIIALAAIRQRLLSQYA
jgi:uncharacterized protein YaaW (UPF0174 family)